MCLLAIIPRKLLLSDNIESAGDDTIASPTDSTLSKDHLSVNWIRPKEIDLTTNCSNP